jgi:mono/diheme cytochrome c family protein
MSAHTFISRILPSTCIVVILFVLLLLPFGCKKNEQHASNDQPYSPAQQPVKEDPVTRGKYLVSAGACNDCHTPLKMGPKGPEPDLSRLLSGHPETLKMSPPPKIEEPWGFTGSSTSTAFAGPWGISYAINLTPDQNTGLGIWTEDQFVRAIKTGKHFGVSRAIMPPMPWPSYSNMTDEDLKAIYAYLRSIPPITNHVPEYEPPAQTPKP